MADCRIYKFVHDSIEYQNQTPPMDLDYESGISESLRKNITVDQYGRTISVEYLDPSNDDVVVSEAWAWDATGVGDPSQVTITSTYHMDDGGTHPKTRARVREFVNEDSTMAERLERIRVVENVKSQLMALSDEFGQTPTQARAKLSDFVRTFNQEIFLFEQIYSQDLADAINADATIGWLDTEYPTGSGVTIRERLVTRFTPPAP